MPLVLRQMLAQMISAANIARIEQVRCRPQAADGWQLRLPAATSQYLQQQGVLILKIQHTA
jgi:hypothetical protein